ncbi:MAG: TonB-dependent receptor [Bacteroidia bacterium]|nr:TonB-dependent receptor [Bacteroidia bacterium]
MKYALFIITLLLCIGSKAQTPPAARPVAGKTPAIGRLYGKVIDSTSKEPVEYAAITLLSMGKDSIITGALSKANGDFLMEKIPFGAYRLRIQSIGFNVKMIRVQISPVLIDQDLGNIRISTSNTALKQVTVQGEKNSVNMNIDRKVYNVEKDISVKGGTALDVMKNVPGVTVDADGNVALRNSSPTIFVDGRPTTLTLEQIPADQIERVEVITNPSAKFDASASGGILNVIMKKNTKPGYNGVVGANMGTNNRYGINTNLNIKEKKFNFSLSYNLNTRGNKNNGYTYRTNLFEGKTTGYFNQKNINQVNNAFHNGRLGIDYNVTNRTTITLAQSVTNGVFKMDDGQRFDIRDSANQMLIYGNRINRQDNGFQNATSQITLRHSYPKKGKEFIADVSYNFSKNHNNSTFTTYNYLYGGGLLPDNPQVQENTGAGNGNMATFQFDFTNPVNDSTKLEWGFKSNYKLNNSKLDASLLNYALGEYIRDSALSNNYKVTDMVNAAYVNYSGIYRKIGFQTGLRFEQTYFIAKLIDKNQQFDYFYPDGGKNLWNAIFPSIYLSKKVNPTNEFQLNFSRKINRPNYMQMMPFIMFSDRQSYRIGNPALGPEFINIAEANYFRLFKNGSWLSSAYAKYLDHAITSYVYPLPTDTSILVSTFTNGKSSWNYGWENTVKFSFAKKLDLTFNANVYYTTITASPATGTTGTLQNSGYSWNGKATVSYKFPKAFTLQWNGSYEAPKIIPQGTTKEVYFMDLSLNKDIGKRLSFNATLSDVFNTKRWGAFYESSTFTQNFSRRWDTRFFRVGLTWRFGETDVSIFRKKPQRRDGQGGMEMEY